MNIRIRQAKVDDLATITRFNQNMAWETENKSLDESVITAAVSAVLTSNDRGFYLLAEVETKPAGCLMITYEWSDWRNYWFWWIQSVYVEPTYRRRGVYQRLYDEVKNLSSNHGNVGGIRLYVESENHIAQKTYERLGMKQIPYLMYESNQ